MSNLFTSLEHLHKLLSQANGRLSLALVKGKISNRILLEIKQRVEEAYQITKEIP